MNDENIEFSNACYEVLEILKHIKKEDIDKIPEDDINMLKKNANYNHNFTYNPDISIREQKVLKLTKGIIAMFFEKYTATEKQKQKIALKRKYDFTKLEDEKVQKYNVDVFKDRREKQENNNEIQNKNTQLVVKSEEKWYKKVLKAIENFFKLKKK